MLFLLGSVSLASERFLGAPCSRAVFVFDKKIWCSMLILFGIKTHESWETFPSKLSKSPHEPLVFTRPSCHDHGILQATALERGVARVRVRPSDLSSDDSLRSFFAVAFFGVVVVVVVATVLSWKNYSMRCAVLCGKCLFSVSPQLVVAVPVHRCSCPFVW